MERAASKAMKVKQALDIYRSKLKPGSEALTCQGCFWVIGKEGEGSPDELIIKNCKGFVTQAGGKVARVQSSGCRLIHY